MSQMSDAFRRMAEHRADAMTVDRRGWTQQQWADDAERLMGDLDGSVSSLLNGHVMGLIAERDRLRAAVDAALALLADGPDTWTPYDSRDTGETFLAESVRDFTAELRRALTTEEDQ